MPHQIRSEPSVAKRLPLLRMVDMLYTVPLAALSSATPLRIPPRLPLGHPAEACSPCDHVAQSL
jgi:hypothetical protein